MFSNFTEIFREPLDPLYWVYQHAIRCILHAESKNKNWISNIFIKRLDFLNVVLSALSRGEG